MLLKLNFFLFGKQDAKKREMLSDFLHMQPQDINGKVTTYQFSYKELLPLTANFIYCDDVAAMKDFASQAGSIQNVLVVFNVTDTRVLTDMTAEYVSTIIRETGTIRPILVGYNTAGTGTNRVAKDKILKYAQENDFFYYFEVMPKSKYDFRALFKRLITENLAEFRQQFPEKYQEEIKEARRAKVEAEKKAAEEAEKNAG